MVDGSGRREAGGGGGRRCCTMVRWHYWRAGRVFRFVASCTLIFHAQCSVNPRRPDGGVDLHCLSRFNPINQ